MQTRPQPFNMLFLLYREVSKETKRRVKFQRWSQEQLNASLARMEGEDGLIASIIYPVFAALALNQEPATTNEFVPALSLNGPHRHLAPIVREYLQGFCEYLEDTVDHLRAVVAERPNADGEPCLGLVRITDVVSIDPLW